MGSLEDEIASLAIAMLSPTLSKMRACIQSMTVMESELLSSSSTVSIKETERKTATLLAEFNAAMSKFRKDSFKGEAERTLKRHGITSEVMLKSPAMAKKLQHIQLNMIRNVQLHMPEVDMLIDMKKRGLPNEEYIARATLKFQSEMYDELLNEADSFLKGISIIATAVIGDVGKAEEELNALCVVHQRQNEMIEKIILDANERILQRTGVDREAYEAYRETGGRNVVQQQAKELEQARRKVLEKLAIVNKVVLDVRARIADKRARVTGYSEYSDQGSDSLYVESYFGTVHGRGRCRRSTSFGKYVLSLS